MATFHYPTPSSGLGPSPSVDLNDLLACADFKVPNLLSESFSQDSLSVSSSSIPSFPSKCTAPLTTVVGFGNNLPMFPQGVPRVGGICTENAVTKTTLTAPTPPRLRTMLKESLCVRKWAECLVVAGAPGHIPWGDLGETPSLSWIPEGSSYSPEAFKKALLGARLSREVKVRKPHVIASTHSEETLLSFKDSRPLLCPSSTSFHKGLVFEHEIAFGSADKRRRWSLQVPASAMNPEMVDMMLELRDLNAFFKNGMHALDQSDDVKDKVVPSLVVSNSNYALPISLESCGNLTLEAPLPLAARRGKKMPAPLSPRNGPDEFEYPGIPTAFLGSPSAYSPNFELANQSDGPSMGLEEMVATLRAAVPGRSPSITGAFETELPNSAATGPLEEENEWAFADDLLKKYGDRIDFPDSITTTLKARQSILHPSRKGLLPQNLGDFESNSSDSVSASSHGTSDISIKACNHWDFKRPHSEQSSSKNLVPPPVLGSRPPSAPLPPRPALVGPSSPKRVVGILKSCKSVRFASLPSRCAVPSTVPEPLSIERRNDLKTPSNASLRRPSPLRKSYAPPSTTSTPAPAHPARTAVSRVGGRKSTGAEDTVCRLAPIVKPSSTLKPAPATNRLSISSPLASFNPNAKQGAIPAKNPVWTTTSSPGRHSLGGGPKGNITASGAENRARAASSCTSAPSRWSTLNENVRRRGSAASLKDAGAQKSRMRAPLRNIFTRFK